MFIMTNLFQWIMKKSSKSCGIYYINMVGIDWKLYENNGVETVAVSDEKLWLNEKHMEEWLDHKNLPIITNKFLQAIENMNKLMSQERTQHK